MLQNLGRNFINAKIMSIYVYNSFILFISREQISILKIKLKDLHMHRMREKYL